LHRLDALAPGLEHGRYIAERMPGARMVDLPWDDVAPFVGDLEALVDEIQEFVTGDHYQPGPDRVLATILFTDIVDSTATASRLGDQRWNQLLVDHDALVRRELERFGGRFVKDTGDGTLATFDGSSRGVRCALAIRDGARHLGPMSAPACTPGRSSGAGSTSGGSLCTWRLGRSLGVQRGGAGDGERRRPCRRSRDRLRRPRGGRVEGVYPVNGHSGRSSASRWRPGPDGVG
jgi:hypothetical protein